jgi:hypothetical protein
MESELVNHMPKNIKIAVNGVVDQAASQEVSDHVNGVVQDVLDLLGL